MGTLISLTDADLATQSTWAEGGDAGQRDAASVAVAADRMERCLRHRLMYPRGS